MLRPVSTFLHGRNAFYVSLLLLPPLLWLGTVYLGSLFALLMQSFYAIDEFTARIVPEFTLTTYGQLFTQPANVDIVLRTVLDGGRGHDRLPRRRLPARQLHGAPRRPEDEGALLRRRDAADVDQLPRQGLRVAADPRQAGHRVVGVRLRSGSAARSTRCSPRRSSAARRSPRPTSACSSCSCTCGCRS